MQTAIACLETHCGPLVIFDSAALVAVGESLSKFHESKAVKFSAAELVSRKVTDVGASDARAELKFEGFNIQEWAVFPKMKSRIASTKCRENGRLKALLNVGGHDSLSHHQEDDIDQLFAEDPWKHSSLVAAPVGKPTIDAWSGWGRKLTDEISASDENSNGDIRGQESADSELQHVADPVCGNCAFIQRWAMLAKTNLKINRGLAVILHKLTEMNAPSRANADQPNINPPSCMNTEGCKAECDP